MSGYILGQLGPFSASNHSHSRRDILYKLRPFTASNHSHSRRDILYQIHPRSYCLINALHYPLSNAICFFLVRYEIGALFQVKRLNSAMPYMHRPTYYHG